MGTESGFRGDPAGRLAESGVKQGGTAGSAGQSRIRQDASAQVSTRSGDWRGRMKLEVFEDAEAVARAAAATIAADARAAVAARGRFIMEVSGGKTPWIMLRALAGEQVPWKDVHVFQVDERIAPAGDPDRNLTHLRASLLEHAPLPPQEIYAMPVESHDLEAAAQQYARTLEQVAGSPPVLDLAHLGMGPDGHTASLVPGDPVLKVTDADVGLTDVYMLSLIHISEPTR